MTAIKNAQALHDQLTSIKESQGALKRKLHELHDRFRVPETMSTTETIQFNDAISHVENGVKQAAHGLDVARRINNRAKKQAEDKQSANNNGNAIAQQIKEAMASLDLGDHAVIVVRKDASEESPSEVTEVLREIFG